MVTKLGEKYGPTPRRNSGGETRMAKLINDCACSSLKLVKILDKSKDGHGK